VQGGNAQGMGRRDAQAHIRYRMGSLIKNGHPNSHYLQCLASQGVESLKRYANQGSFQKNLASKGATTIGPNKRVRMWYFF